MTSDEAASDDAASDEAASDEAASAASDGATSSASDDAASDNVASGPLVFRSTILQEHFSSGALFLQEQLDFRSAFTFRSVLPSESSKLHFLLLFICSFRTN